MLQLSKIWIYPVKSLGGISLQQAQITDRGLEHDRRWLLIDENNSFLSQREHPQLALFQLKIIENQLQVDFTPENSSVIIPLKFKEGAIPISVSVWEDVMLAFEVCTDVSKWFTERLNFPVRLVYMPDESHRKIDTNYAVTSNDINSFSDGFPFLIIGQASLDDLNNRLKIPVAMNRFRPNFVFMGGDPYVEDTFKKFTIGTNIFYGVKPCSRCVMTTVDQEKGRVSGKEPLRTLAKYRMVDNAVFLGQNLIGPNTGKVMIGDLINSSQE